MEQGGKESESANQRVSGLCGFGACSGGTVLAIMRHRTTGLLNWWLTAGLTIVCASSCTAQYHLIPGKFDEAAGCDPKTPARICLGSGTAHCYAPESTKVYIFGMEPKAVQVGQLVGQPMILFSAMFSGCGSGTLTDYSLLTVRQGEFVNLLPKVELTNLSEYKSWSLPAVSELPVLVTADFIWDFGNPTNPHMPAETHYGDHRYRIHAFVFDARSERYAKAVGYTTSDKYPGEDSEGPMQVLEAERPQILARLRSGPKGP